MKRNLITEIDIVIINLTTCCFHIVAFYYCLINHVLTESRSLIKVDRML